MFAGPIEVDETYIGGKRKNMPKAKHETLVGRGAVGKAVPAGANDPVNAAVVPATDRAALRSLVQAGAETGATIRNDDAAACRSKTGFVHEVVKHSVSEYVRGMAHTNAVESFRSMPKRGSRLLMHGLRHRRREHQPATPSPVRFRPSRCA